MKLGDLALQPIDFCKQLGHAFDVICVDRSNPLQVSPVADAAAIRAEALVGSGCRVAGGAVLTDMLTRRHVRAKWRWEIVQVPSTAGQAAYGNSRCT